MRIGFIGAGRVGFTMGKYLKLSGADISGYYSRNAEHARDAADFTDTSFYEKAEDLIKTSDAVILTVSDGAIKTVFDEIKTYPELAGKIVCHTSGSLSSSVFEDTEIQVYGYSIHPIYAVSDRYASYKEFSKAYLTIEGHEKYLDDLADIFKSAGMRVGIMDAANKTKYHASCVMASNLVCGLYAGAVDLLTQCGFDSSQAEEMLVELFKANADGIAERGVVAQLTGPIDRNDVKTVEAHLANVGPDVKDLYVEASKKVLKVAKEKNPDKDYNAMAILLENAGVY